MIKINYKNLIFILLFQITNSFLFSYDKDAIKALDRGEKDLTFKDFSGADLSGKKIKGVNFAGSVFTAANLSKSKIINSNFTAVDFTGVNCEKCNIEESIFEDIDFTDASLFATKFKKCNFTRAICAETDLRETSLDGCIVKNMILLKTKIEDIRKKELISNGAVTVVGSIMANSDIHLTNAKVKGEKQAFVDEKRKHAGTMVSVASKIGFDKKLKNNVIEVIYAGDLVDRGNIKSYWKDFEDLFIEPFQKKPFKGENKIHVTLLKGNHDRFEVLSGNILKDETPFDYETYVTKEIDKFNKKSEKIEAIEEDYFKVYDKQFNLDKFVLSECPTKNDYKPVEFFEKNFNKDRKVLFVTHYSPLHNFDWWTSGNEPRENQNECEDKNKMETAKKADKTVGKEILSKLEKTLLPYKQNISLWIAGHFHQTYIKRWKDILVLSVGGGNRFALVHFNEYGNVVVIELYHHKKGREVLRYYPAFENSQNHRTRFIVKYFRQYLNRFPSPEELGKYCKKNLTLWEIDQDISTNVKV